MAGLYETALDELCARDVDGAAVRPEDRRLDRHGPPREDQIQALFDRPLTQIFPPPGPDRRDSFFAETVPASRAPARLYLGVAAQGRSPKVVMRRPVWPCWAPPSAPTATPAAHENAENPADPYMTLLGYFNSLRELGGARRIVEDEVRNTLTRLRRARAGSARPRRCSPTARRSTRSSS